MKVMDILKRLNPFPDKVVLVSTPGGIEISKVLAVAGTSLGKTRGITWGDKNADVLAGIEAGKQREMACVVVAFTEADRERLRLAMCTLAKAAGVATEDALASLKALASHRAGGSSEVCKTLADKAEDIMRRHEEPPRHSYDRFIPKPIGQQRRRRLLK
jgi:hypothetical protein